jgi:hypothetical protein
MSLIEKAVARAGMELLGDKFPQRQRGVKWMQRFLTELRKGASEMIDHLLEIEKDRNDAQRRISLLQERIRVLENENREHRVKAWASGIEALTTADRTKLIETTALSQAN